MPPRRSQRLQQQREAASQALAETEANATSGALYRRSRSNMGSRRLRSPPAPQQPAHSSRRRGAITRRISSNQRRGVQQATSNARRSRRLISPSTPQQPAHSTRRRGGITRRISSNQRRGVQQALSSARRPRGRPRRGGSNTDSVPVTPTNPNISSRAEEGLFGYNPSLALQFSHMVNQLGAGQTPLISGPGPSRMGDNRAATGRLHRELSDFMREPPDGCKVEMVDDDILHWRATIVGPTDTPYEGGHFILDLSFPSDYPFHPPQVFFLTKIYHCNITSSGYICLDILGMQWSPALTVAKVLLSIVSLLSDPNPNDPLESTIAHLYKQQRDQHDLNARAWTERYATPPQPATNFNVRPNNPPRMMPPRPAT